VTASFCPQPALRTQEGEGKGLGELSVAAEV
jgi:hypothetical protein